MPQTPIVTLSPDYLASLVARACDGGFADRELAHLSSKIPGFGGLVRSERDQRETSETQRRLAAAAADRADDKEHRKKVAYLLATQAAAIEARERLEQGFDRLPAPHAAAVLRLAQVSPASLATARRAAETLHRLSDELPRNEHERQQRRARFVEMTTLSARHEIAARTLNIISTVVDAIEPPPSEVSAAGRALAIGDETEIFDAAKRRAGEHQDRFRALGTRGLADYEVAEQTCPLFWRRRLRRESLRAQAYYDSALRTYLPGRPVSGHTMSHWEERQQRAAEWARLHTVHFSDGEVVAMTDIQNSSTKSRRARLYAVSKGLERVAERHDLVAVFITITLPGCYHPTTSTGGFRRPNPDWNPELGPAAQRLELGRIWELFRANLAKFRETRGYFGVAVPEPHEDGTPHLHALLYLPARLARGDGDRPTVNVVRRLLREATGAEAGTAEFDRQTKAVEVEAGKGSTPASYIMKYILKSLAVSGDDKDEDEDEPAQGQSDGHRAWLASRGIRGFRFLGAHGFAKILQKLWTITDDELANAGPLAQQVAQHLADVRALGAMAGEAVDDDNKEAAREGQTDAMADALLAAGMLRGFRCRDRLRLTYESATTSYGRPTKRVHAISERGPDKCLGRRRTVYDIDDQGRVSGGRSASCRVLPAGAAGIVYRLPTSLLTHLRPLVPAAYGRGVVLDEHFDEDGCASGRSIVEVRHAVRRDERPGRFAPFTVILGGDELGNALAGNLVVIPAHRRTATMVADKEVTVSVIYPRGPGRPLADGDQIWRRTPRPPPDAIC